MRFPSELIDLIVSQGLDSCRTSIAWSNISRHYRDLITKQLGLIVLDDGTKESDETKLVLDYQVLMVEGNTLHFETDHLEYEKLKQFVVNFSRLLVVIHSDRSYNDVLASILNDIARFSAAGTSLCIVYSNSLNFLSKLYFRELSLYQDKIRLCELHVLGNGKASVDEVCDLNTLFERTYLYNLKSIYSLDVQSSQHQLISQEPLTIKQLNFVAYDEASSGFFSQCPNLKAIESMKYPIKYQDTLYRLPRCDSITLTHYVSGCHYSALDGSAVGKELTLVPSLRSEDPQFHGLYFPRLKSLKLKLSDAVSHLVRFHNCNFSSLDELACGSCTIPWDDMLSAGWSPGELAVTLTSDDQLRWLTSSPPGIDRLRILNPQTRFMEFPASRIFETSNLNFNTISLELNIIWQCYLLQKLILPNLEPRECLMITLDENALSESLASSSGKGLNLELEDDYIVFRVPPLRHFQLIEISSRNAVTESSCVSRTSPVDTALASSHAKMNSLYFDADATGEICYAVSPSEFRRNSLAGLTNESARRQSAIVFLNGSRTRRASSISSSNFDPVVPASSDNPFDGDTVIFEFSKCSPAVFTTNLDALESSLFSWKNLESNRIPFLRVLVRDQDVHNQVGDFDSIIPILVPRIIEVLKFPYDIRLPMMVIDKFQAVVDLTNLTFVVTVEQRLKLSTDMQAYLGYKGCKIPVLTDQPNTGLTVSILLCFDEIEYDIEVKNGF
ncbi:hypothetical protein HG536_0C01470 [Torulaspora globosa]|uniref:Uncharacterized protein n=1 Tax=Torulaspora globosa TaxID=48254 RepID=A0A7G3ZEP3_9SACH|nr:uncharacterized protein HG536_0C01470 [Torulaspora globosa]QLL31979.1 hypothetical protein HG536_0C01470 [Torulaspora globosa]